MAKKRTQNRQPAGNKLQQGGNQPSKPTGEKRETNNKAEPDSTESPATKPGSHDLLFPIVGIGASAGGLEAFTELLAALPAKTGMAFVLVQHLDPQHVSTLAEILARQSKLHVAETRNRVRIQPDHVYVIPRKTSITMQDGMLILGPRTLLRGQQISIDTFFQSLAEHHGPRAIGVILSGAASDGTSGLQAIKAAGGITFAQDPKTAKVEGMPRSAIAAGCIDFVLPPAEIAAELLRLRSHPYVTTSPEWRQNQKEILPSYADAVTRILALVRNATGVDFGNYKANTVRRRILRRAMLRRAETLEKYIETLRADSAEIRALYEDILINVTEFFRDPEVFDALNTLVFPRITKQPRAERQQIRMWIPGCSSGEEVYSLAIALIEFLGDRADEASIQIFATDLSEFALEKARAGIYPATIAQNVSRERLQRFFTKVEPGYQIQKRIRELCVFARHNLTRDPPFSRLDLISCRNVLIYLSPVLQERIIPTFQYALRPNGFLLLGSSETVSTHPDLFSVVHKKAKIYTRTPANSPAFMHFAGEPPPEKAQPMKKPGAEPWTEFDLQRETDRMVLHRYSPPGVVIDDDMNILHFQGHTSPFLEPASGVPSLNLLRMVNESLSLEVKNAVAKARKDNKPVRREGLRIKGDGAQMVNIEVIPFKRTTALERKYLLMFEPAQAEQQLEAVKGKRSQAVAALERENEHLRQELEGAKDYLQSIIEDHEAAHEELQSASEEIQSSNEELQSTNEELETAKEELQSTNEELNTVNDELQNRNIQLAQIGNDLLNLLANVNIPILILDHDLRIRKFTPITERVLNLISSDVGRPIRDINLRIPVPEMERLVHDVMESLMPRVTDVFDLEGRRYSLRVRPYRTDDNRIDGVVMVFVDMDTARLEGFEDSPAGAVRGDIGGNGRRSGWTESKHSRAHLLFAQEEERRRLSHELHDELNQRLALLEVSLQSLENRTKQPHDWKAQLQLLRKSVADLSDDLRRIAYRLHPSMLEDLGLVAAVQSYCEEFAARERIPVKFTHRELPDDIPAPVALALYRIVQEALRNVAKHSGAKRATIALAGDRSRVTLSIRDTGSGFEPSIERLKGGLGLKGMQERMALLGGELVVESAPGKGTEVTAIAPLDSASQEQSTKE